MSGNSYSNTSSSDSDGINKIRQYEPAGYLQQDTACQATQNILLSQRNRFLKSRPRTIRFEFVSPYTGKTASHEYNETESKSALYTQEQLDMRRKAEILQYNKSSSKGNKMTRAQRYSQIASGAFQRKTQSQVDANGRVTIFNISSCSTDKYVPTSTTKSDVPGKPMMLFYDPSVPLYNYAEKINNTQFEEEESEETWVHTTTYDIFLQDNTSTTIFSITIGKIDNAFTLYDINIPIAIYMEGNVNDLQNQEQETIQINAIELSIYYGNSIVNVTYNSNIQDLIDTDVQFTTTASLSDDSFKLTQYIGNLKINNLRLSTQYGFIYDMHLKVNVNTNALLGDYSNVITGCYANILSSQQVNKNVTIHSPLLNDLPSLQQFSISE